MTNPALYRRPRFRHRVEAIVEAFSSMQEDLDKERKAIMKQWVKREEQIKWAMGATVGVRVGEAQVCSATSPTLTPTLPPKRAREPSCEDA